MQSGLYHHYEREPTSLVSKLWTLGRFNTRHRGHHWRLDDTPQRGISLELGERQTFPSSFQHFLSMLKSLHFTPFYKENLIFTLWKGENYFFWGEAVSHWSIVFSPKWFRFVLKSHVRARDMVCITPPQWFLENSTFKSLSHHPAPGCLFIVVVNSSWWGGGKCAHVCPCSIVP